MAAWEPPPQLCPHSPNLAYCSTPLVLIHAAAPARALMAAWESLPKLYPPSNWQPPPPAGYEAAQVCPAADDACAATVHSTVAALRKLPITAAGAAGAALA